MDVKDIKDAHVTHAGLLQHNADGTTELQKITHAGLIARSPEGTAAKGMNIRGNEDLWVEIQANTFRNWVNEHLKDANMQVSRRAGTTMVAMVVEEVECWWPNGGRTCADVVGSHALRTRTSRESALVEVNCEIVDTHTCAYAVLTHVGMCCLSGVRELSSTNCVCRACYLCRHKCMQAIRAQIICVLNCECVWLSYHGICYG